MFAIVHLQYKRIILCNSSRFTNKESFNPLVGLHKRGTLSLRCLYPQRPHIDARTGI